MRHGPILNKWNLILYFQKDYRQRNPFAWRFGFGICKFIEFPPEGFVIKAGKYKGFLYFLDVSFLVILQQETRYVGSKRFRFYFPKKIQPAFSWF